MKCYVDSTVLLRYLLTDDREFERVRDYDQVGSSELLVIECRRVLHRYRLDSQLTDEELGRALMYFDEVRASIRVFDLTRSVKDLASGAFPTAIGTLDALHLATARLWADQDSEPLVLFTHDQRMRLCAGAMGLHAV